MFNSIEDIRETIKIISFSATGRFLNDTYWLTDTEIETMAQEAAAIRIKEANERYGRQD